MALSTSEAEFIAAAEAGKQILYIRSILDSIGIPQEASTTLYEDNQGALLMDNAQKPTKRTKHMDIRHFALQDWVNQDLLTLKRITTSDNYANVMTKSLHKSLFYKHMNFIQGKIIPQYSYAHSLWKNNHMREEIEITPEIKMLNFKLDSKSTMFFTNAQNRGGSYIESRINTPYMASPPFHIRQTTIH